MAGLLVNIVTLPWAPVRIVVSLAKVVQREAEKQMYGSANVRRELEELDRAYESGEISEEEYEQAQEATIGRLLPAGDAAERGSS